jgi:hypothetical protein
MHTAVMIIAEIRFRSNSRRLESAGESIGISREMSSGRRDIRHMEK